MPPVLSTRPHAGTQTNRMETGLAQAVVAGLSAGFVSEGLAAALRLHVPSAESLR